MIAEQEVADYWHKQVMAWRTSGLSLRAFCDQQNLVYHQFAYWKKKYQTRGPRTTENLTPGTGFTQVVMAGGLTSYSPTSTSTSTNALTLTLPSGITIGGLHPDNIAWLGALLEQLG